MIDIRSKLTNKVGKVLTRYDLRFRGSWLDHEQHLVPVVDKFFSLSDIDLLSDGEVAPSVLKQLRGEIEECTKDILLSCPSISVRTDRTAEPIRDFREHAHNTLFWSYIVLFELKDQLQKAKVSDYCDVESYWMNKFLLNIWKNLLLDHGELPTSYTDILGRLEGLSEDTKNGLTQIKMGAPLSFPAKNRIATFRDYTVGWVTEHYHDAVRAELFDLLKPDAWHMELVLILERLDHFTASELERGVLEYTRAKSGI